VVQRRLEVALGVPFATGNRVEILRNGAEYFPAMLEAIRGASATIDFLTFVYWQGPIADEFAATLSERARAGVRVRVLLDRVGADDMTKKLLETMRSAGAEVAWFRPLSWRVWRNTHRTHRKVLLCDDRVGFTGGVGIAEEWQGNASQPSEWRDTHFRVEGPAIDGLRAAFLGNWQEDGRTFAIAEERIPDVAAPGEVKLQMVRTTATHGWSDVTTALRALTQLATRRLYVTAAYFSPDPVARDLLIEAAKRGVDVRILTPGPYTDSRVSKHAGDAYLTALLSAGVRVFRYQRTVLHAKIVTIDGHFACVGSANFNVRSMRQDDEILMIVANDAVAHRLDTHFEEDCEVSRELSEEDWRQRSRWKRLCEWVASLVRAHV